MLFFLTGDTQIGKTRWLQSVIDELADAGVISYGVIAPGRWIERSGAYEKTGIDNVMLPQGERVDFAEPAERGWRFHEAAIQRVDRHFALLAGLAGVPISHDGSGGSEEFGASKLPALPEAPGTPEGFEAPETSRAAKSPEAPNMESQGCLLVVDELGWMELEKGCGLTSAVRLLDGGATHLFPHAVVVVRETLLPLAMQRFEDAEWGGMKPIAPDKASRDDLFAHVMRGDRSYSLMLSRPGQAG